MHVCAKSSGVALELAYTRPPGSTTFANWLFSNPPWYTLFAPQILHKLLSSNALGKMQYSQEHFKTMVYAEFGGAIRVYYGEFENREYPHPQGMTRRAKTPQLSGECMGPPPIDWCIMTEPRDLRRHCQRLSANSKKCHSFLQRIAGFHMTSLKFKPQNYQSYRDFTYTMY